MEHPATLLEFSMVGKNALCVNIHTRSAWSGAQWLDLAQRYYGPSTSIVGIKEPRD